VSSLAVAVPVIGNSERVVIFAVVLAGVAEVWRSLLRLGVWPSADWARKNSLQRKVREILVVKTKMGLAIGLGDSGMQRVIFQKGSGPLFFWSGLLSGSEITNDLVEVRFFPFQIQIHGIPLAPA
jgi:hypothetical protein